MKKLSCILGLLIFGFGAVYADSESFFNGEIVNQTNQTISSISYQVCQDVDERKNCTTSMSIEWPGNQTVFSLVNQRIAAPSGEDPGFLLVAVNGQKLNSYCASLGTTAYDAPGTILLQTVPYAPYVVCRIA